VPEPAAAKAVIWDMDGVIADTGPYHYRAWRGVLSGYGVTLSETEFKRTFGRNNDAIIRELLGKDVSPATVAAVARDKEIAFRDIARSRLEPSAGVKELHRALKAAGYKMALASSAPPENIRLVLDVLGLEDGFDAVVGDDEVSRGKPDPEVFIKAAAKLGVAPAQALVIEDATGGVGAARAAGMRCLAVTATHPRAALNEADLVVDSLKEVTPAIVRALLEGGA